MKLANYWHRYAKIFAISYTLPLYLAVSLDVFSHTAVSGDFSIISLNNISLKARSAVGFGAEVQKVANTLDGEELL